jgi:hypothetical protein
MGYFDAARDEVPRDGATLHYFDALLTRFG